MAGMVFFPDGRDWRARSSTFYLVVEMLAERARDDGLVAHLQKISEANLGSFSVTDFPESQRRELSDLVRGLPAVARETLPDTLSRDAVIQRIDELADLFLSQ